MASVALFLLFLFTWKEHKQWSSVDFIAAQNGTIFAENDPKAQAALKFAGLSAWLPRLTIIASVLAMVTFLAGTFPLIHTDVNLRIAKANDLANEITQTANEVAFEEFVEDLANEIQSLENASNGPNGTYKQVVRSLERLVAARKAASVRAPESLRRSADAITKGATSSSDIKREKSRLLKSTSIRASIGWNRISYRDLSKARTALHEHRETRKSKPGAQKIPARLRAIASGAILDAAAAKTGFQAAKATFANSNPITLAIVESIYESFGDKFHRVFTERVLKIVNTTLTTVRQNPTQTPNTALDAALDKERPKRTFASQAGQVKAKLAVLNARMTKLITRFKRVRIPPSVETPPSQPGIVLPEPPSFPRPPNATGGSICPRGTVACFCGVVPLGCLPRSMCKGPC